MKTRCVLLAALLALTAAQAPAQGPKESDKKSYHLRWEDLSGMTQGRVIEMNLPNGVTLKGVALAFEPANLVLDVTSSSDKRAYPKGRTLIPRPQVRTLRFNKKSSHGGAIVGATVGGVLGALIGLGVLASGGTAKGAAFGLAVPLGMGTLMGAACDGSKIEVTVEGGQ